MPFRILGPFDGMSEKEYVWMLTTDRCGKCHEVPVDGYVSMYWEYAFKGCEKCFNLLVDQNKIESELGYHETKYSICFAGYLAPRLTCWLKFGPSRNPTDTIPFPWFCVPKAWQLSHQDTIRRINEVTHESGAIRRLGDEKEAAFLAPFYEMTQKWMKMMIDDVLLVLMNRMAGRVIF
jgi:hypothetical protein